MAGADLLSDDCASPGFRYLHQISADNGKRPIAVVRAAPYKIRMPTDASQREQALSDLGHVTATLRARIVENTLTGSDMILGCRRILDLWIASGGSSLDDPVIGFTGIESQTDHVLGGSRVRVGRDVDHTRFEPGSASERAEIEEIGRFFAGSFRRMVKELGVHLSDR